jgi:hypothetical protein
LLFVFSFSDFVLLSLARGMSFASYYRTLSYFLLLRHILLSPAVLLLLLISRVQADVAVSNVRGPEKPIHLCGHEVTQIVGFLPPPPGCPVGIAVTSYRGSLQLSVNADETVSTSPFFLFFLLFLPFLV